MKLFACSLIVLISLVFASSAQTPDTVQIKKHISFLGNDSLQGRGTGSIASGIAAEYIAQHLKMYNLQPIVENNSFFQEIPMHGSRPLEGSRLILNTNGSTRLLNLNEDYLLYRAGAQTFIPNPLPLVFVGYGIIAPEYDYNDYQTVDVQDKIVVFLDGEPQSTDKSYFQGEQKTIYSSPDTKQRLALARGARGSILIPRPDTNWITLQRAFTFENISLAYSVSTHLSILINPQMAEILFQSSDQILDQIYDHADQGLIRSFPLQSELSFEGQFIFREFRERNVIGLLRGQNPRLMDTYILLTAHYDHLGIGPTMNGDSIYNGVFDNASGVAGLLEIARLFSKQSPAPECSIVFIFLTGEEKGLLGSTYYTDHPLVPLYQSIVNINVDGLALFETFQDVFLVGALYSTLQTDIKDVFQEMGLGMVVEPEQHFIQYEVINRSDHFSFAKAGIPFMLIAEGTTYTSTTKSDGLERILNWDETIYHTPFDDLNQEMNFSAAQQHCEIIFKTASFLANSGKSPQWRSGSAFINARLQSIAEKR